MRKMIAGLLAACLGVAALASPAAAGIYADDATRCLAKSMSEADQIALVKWIFGGMALHPSLKEFSNISPAQRAEMDKQMASVVMKMLLQTCRKETVDAIKYEGPGFLEKSFESVGQFAMAGLMTNPDVSKGLSTWATPDIVQSFEVLAKEAGRPTAPKP